MDDDIGKGRGVYFDGRRFFGDAGFFGIGAILDGMPFLLAAVTSVGK